MNAVSVKILKRFLLSPVFIIVVVGCGSNSSTTSSPESSGTGSIAAKLVWSSADSKTTTKTLHKAPDGVDFIQIVVLDSNRKSLGSGNFAASLGTGTVDGIAAGSGYTVEVRGLVSGSLIYERVVSNVTVKSGSVTDLGFITMASITTATELPVFGVYSTKYVTLTASTAATIYYTTNGKEPVFGNTSTSFGTSPIPNIFIKKQPTGSTFLKFFSINSLGAQELTKIKEYIFP